MDKKKKTSESLLKAINKYNKDSINFAISYKRLERKEGQRVKAYLQEKGTNANSYIKNLIKQDLDNKGFFITDTEQNNTGNNNDDTADI